MGKLVILTCPTGRSGTTLLRSGARVMKAYGLAAAKRSPQARFRHLGGHMAVTRSLVSGLRELGRDFSLNPRVLPPGTSTVGVLADVRALSQAIEWRRSGRIARLLAGPNLVILPSDEPGLMESEAVDVCVTNSDWIKELYARDCPAIAAKLAVWPAGVDAEWWRPAREGSGKRGSAIVYQKNIGSTDGFALHEIEAASSLLIRYGYRILHLEYGRYTPEGFRKRLRASDLAVFFSQTESQGIALAEAWSTDVPTFVWNNSFFQYKGVSFRGSSAPYLSNQTGAFFDKASDLEPFLSDSKRLGRIFTPRDWVLTNLTDAVTARRYLDLARC